MIKTVEGISFFNGGGGGGLPTIYITISLWELMKTFKKKFTYVRETKIWNCMPVWFGWLNESKQFEGTFNVLINGHYLKNIK